VAPSFRSHFRRDESDKPAEGQEVEIATEDSDVQNDEGSSSENLVVDDDSGEWLAYELHEWASQSRAMLAQLLIADKVVHSWQGTTLLAHESVEEAVDALLDEVEAATDPELDSDKAQVAFEMEGWSGEQQALLAERLGAAAVPHEFYADGDLVCHEEDEEQAELVIEDILARAADEGLEDLEGLALNDLLSALFGATDRVRKDVHDGVGVLGCVTHGHRLRGVATPFGFAAGNWVVLRDSAGDLADLLESKDATDADVTDLAARLRDALHRII